MELMPSIRSSRASSSDLALCDRWPGPRAGCSGCTLPRGTRSPHPGWPMAKGSRPPRLGRAG
eukprot:8380707-Pyramimonas_sp.AAC.1